MSAFTACDVSLHVASLAVFHLLSVIDIESSPPGAARQQTHPARWLGIVHRPASGKGAGRQHRTGVKARDGKQVHRDLSRGTKPCAKCFPNRNRASALDARPQPRTTLILSR